MENRVLKTEIMNEGFFKNFKVDTYLTFIMVQDTYRVTFDLLKHGYVVRDLQGNILSLYPVYGDEITNSRERVYSVELFSNFMDVLLAIQQDIRIRDTISWYGSLKSGEGNSNLPLFYLDGFYIHEVLDVELSDVYTTSGDMFSYPFLNVVYPLEVSYIDYEGTVCKVSTTSARIRKALNDKKLASLKRLIELSRERYFIEKEYKASVTEAGMKRSRDLILLEDESSNLRKEFRF